MSTHHQDMSAAYSAARAFVEELHDIAAALSALGIPAGREMNMALVAMSEELKRMNAAYSDCLYQYVDATEQATNNMMRAVFASAGIDMEQAP